MSAVLLVRLKITDLTAWTALHTGRGLIPPGHELLRLSREQLLLFEAEQEGRRSPSRRAFSGPSRGATSS